MKKSHNSFYLLIVLLSCNNTNDNTHLVNTNVTNKDYTDVLKNTTWFSDGIIGLDRSGMQYKLIKALESKGKWAGNMTSFGKNNQFTSFYTAFCGNDCVTASHGHYKFIAQSIVMFSIDSITYNGDCQKPTVRFQIPIKEVFALTIQKDTIFLKKNK